MISQSNCEKAGQDEWPCNNMGYSGVNLKFFNKVTTFTLQGNNQLDDSSSSVFFSGELFQFNSSKALILHRIIFEQV